MYFLLETHLPRSSLIQEVAHFLGGSYVAVKQSFITDLRVTYSIKKLKVSGPKLTNIL